MTNKIISVITQKGGIGKTSTSINLCAELASRGQKILLIDTDPSANSSDILCPDNQDYDKNLDNVLGAKKFDINEAIYPAYITNYDDEGELIETKIADNLYIIPSDISLAVTNNEIVSRAHNEKILEKQLKNLNTNYDYIFIDCPPMLSQLSIISIYASNFFLIPVKYERHALKGINDLFKTIKESKEENSFNYRILRNNLDPRNKKMERKTNKALEPFVKGGATFNTIIKKDEAINLATDSRIPLKYFSQISRTVQDYKSLADEFLEILSWDFMEVLPYKGA